MGERFNLNLLIIDGINFKPLKANQKEDFYLVIAEPYMRKSTIVTSKLNVPPSGPTLSPKGFTGRPQLTDCATAPTK